MTSTVLPALFVSHGAPTMAIEDGPARRHLAGLGGTLGRPDAILVASAHWETAVPQVTTAAAPATIHDFRGFPKALYDIVYPAPGATGAALRAVACLAEAGIDAAEDEARGLDHGAWVPLSLMYPAADIPVAQISIQPDRDPTHHLRVGEALQALRREGVLVLASGSVTHNLRALDRGDPAAAAPSWVVAFGDWLAEALAAGRRDDLLDYRARAPHAALNHPTDEHLLPLFVALGAGGAGPARRLHASHSHGSLAMDVYAFG